MRKIKFRAVVYGKIYPVSVIDWYKNGKINRIKLLDGVGELRKWYYPNEKTIKVIEFTGLKDKNGKEIYEGDIICLTTFNVNKIKDEKPLWEVIFHDGCFAVARPNEIEILRYVFRRSPKNIEIIGNIYENPELLK